MPIDTSAVDYQRSGPVGVVTLHREPFNSYDDVLVRQFQDAWRAAAADHDARVVVLQAEGRHFCGGALLEGGEHGGGPDGPPLTPWVEFELIRKLPKPTIAAVQGGCVGGGLRMVFPCDLIFCSNDAFFSDPTARFGLGGIQSHLHTWWMGPRLAKEMIWSGMRLPAARLHQIGSVNRLYPADELRAATHAFAAEVAEIAPPVLRQSKRASNTTLDIMGMHYIATRMEELMDEEQPLAMQRPDDGD